MRLNSAYHEILSALDASYISDCLERDFDAIRRCSTEALPSLGVISRSQTSSSCQNKALYEAKSYQQQTIQAISLRIPGARISMSNESLYEGGEE